MFQAFLTVLAFVVFLAPLALVAVAWVWTAVRGRGLPWRRRLFFVLGLVGSTAAYAAHFLLRWYLRSAHLDFWREVHVTAHVGNLMIIVTMGSFAVSWLGKGYGRVTACASSLLIATSWFLAQVASF